MEILENSKNYLIMKNNEVLEFWSYETKIATFNKKTSILKLNSKKWDFSQTTLKQLKRFINSYIEKDYYLNRKDFEKRIHKNGNIFLVNESYL